MKKQQNWIYWTIVLIIGTVNGIFLNDTPFKLWMIPLFTFCGTFHLLISAFILALCVRNAKTSRDANIGIAWILGVTSVWICIDVFIFNDTFRLWMFPLYLITAIFYTGILILVVKVLLYLTGVLGKKVRGCQLAQS